jgi:H+-transporting ATPase
MTVIYLCLSVGGQLTVFVSRTRHSFWSRRPGYALSIACLGAQIVATLISVYLPVSLKIDSYIAITIDDKDYPVEAIMKGIDWKMAGFVWAYSIIIFIISDFAKVYFYYALDDENKPDIDIQQIKKTKRPFLPTFGNNNKKKDNQEKKALIKNQSSVELP